MADKSIDYAPIWDDITTLDMSEFAGQIDIISGGFPCQDISVAGNGAGLSGQRSGLFFEILRLTKELRPKFIFLENVPAITSRGGVRVVKEIAEMGYDCRWCVISAASVGASHKRDRWFLLAHSVNNGESSSENRSGLRTQHATGINQQAKDIGKTERTDMLSRDVANTTSKRSQEIGKPERPGKTDTLPTSENQYGCWDNEPENKFEVAGMTDGLSARVHRIKGLGNAVVPVQARQAFKILMGL